MHGDFVILHIIAMLLSHHISRFTGHIMLCMSLINSMTLDITYTCTGIYFITHLIKILGMPRLARKHPYMYGRVYGCY